MMNAESLALLKASEGLRLEAYRDSAGVWTIGYGTTAAAGVGIGPRSGMRITEAEAEQFFVLALDKFSAQIRPLFKTTPNENQYGAMMNLAYNIGVSGFRGSTVLRKFNEGKLKEAADAFLLWDKITVDGELVFSKGLARRRERERALFLKPVGGIAPVPKNNFVWLIIELFKSIFGGKK